MAENYPKFLLPCDVLTHRSGRSIILILALSMVAALIAPLMMPEGCDWRVHTTSEAAALPAWKGLFVHLMFFIANAWFAREAYTLHNEK